MRYCMDLNFFYMQEYLFFRIPLPDLLDGIKKVMQEVMSPMSANLKQPHQTTKYLTRQEVCAKFGISYPTLHRHVNSGLFHCMKVGRKSYFDERQIESSMVKLTAKGGNYGF